MYRSEDCGVFIGLTTMPFGEEKTFYEKEIKEGIFEGYRKNLTAHLKHFTPEENQHDAAFDRYFYKPKAYALFGNFDLAIISLVEDFTISNRIFGPHSHYIKRSLSKALQPHNFTFKTIVGPTPDANIWNDQNEDRPPVNLLQKAEKTFLAQELNPSPPKKSVYPFIGICSLKVNNGLLVGTGGRLLNLILRTIAQHLQAAQQKGDCFEYIEIQSFSWNELTILFFSDSFKTIAKNILQLRSLTFKDLKPDSTAPPVIHSFYNFVNKRCLIRKYMNKNGGKHQLEHSHLFVNTHTILGYDFDLLGQQKPPDYFMDLNDEGLEFYTQWYVKPGHLKACTQRLKSIHQSESNIQIIVGKGDFVYPKEGYRFLDILKVFNQGILTPNVLSRHVRKINTIPRLNFTDEEMNWRPITEEHFYFTQHIKEQVSFKLAELAEIKENLQHCKVSRVIREKVMNMYVNFNDGIQDPNLYTFFIELRPFLEKVRTDIAYYAESDDYPEVNKISWLLDDIVDQFEKAHKNRFQQSYVMSEVTDFNIEFNGGIHQLVSTFDGAYKAISEPLEDNNISFAYVTGFSTVNSKVTSVQLNYFHLFQPETFAAVATHEASNFLLLRSNFPNSPQFEELKQYFQYRDQLDTDLESMATYFLMDNITYYYAYNQDADLYAYWHWNYFLQGSTNYLRDGTINEENFQAFLTRMILLFMWHNKMDGFFLRSIKAPCIQLQEVWFKYLHKCLARAEELMAQPFFQGWFEHSNNSAAYVLLSEFLNLKERGKAPKKLDLNKLMVRFRKKFEQLAIGEKTEPYLHETEFVLMRRYEMDQISQKAMEYLERGQIFVMPISKYYSDAFYVQTLFYAYLKLLRKKNLNDNSVLFRDTQGKPWKFYGPGSEVPASQRTDGSYLFDPLGGIFVCQTDERRAYFRYRAAFLKSLWCFSQTRKCKLLDL